MCRIQVLLGIVEELHQEVKAIQVTVKDIQVKSARTTPLKNSSETQDRFGPKHVGNVVVLDIYVEIALICR